MVISTYTEPKVKRDIRLLLYLIAVRIILITFTPSFLFSYLISPVLANTVPVLANTVPDLANTVPVLANTVPVLANTVPVISAENVDNQFNISSIDATVISDIFQL